MAGTAQAIVPGCEAPDGPAYTLDGQASTLHEQIRASGSAARLLCGRDGGSLKNKYWRRLHCPTDLGASAIHI